MRSPIKVRELRPCGSCEHRSSRTFCNLTAEALVDFEAIGTQAMLPTGAILFREDEPSLGVILICSGQVKLSCTSKDGRTLTLKIAMPGDVLGLSAVIAGTPYEVTAEAMEATQTKRIPRADFQGFLQRHGEASLHAARALSEEYQAVFFDARRLALSGSIAARLAGLLLEWGRTAQCGRPEMQFKMAFTHEELANRTATTRETITRVLGRFQKEKLIEIHDASLLILSPERLEQLSA